MIMNETRSQPLQFALASNSANDPSLWRAWHDFVGHAQTRPQAPAIRVAGQGLTYGDLLERVYSCAAAIAKAESDATRPVTAIYADRSLDSYIGVLAASMLGHAYVPLNPKFPDDRNQIILRQSGASFLVSSPASRAICDRIVADGGVLVTGVGSGTSAAVTPRHNGEVAYILFTSGSTGMPKGVPIRHSNLCAYLDAAISVTDFGPDDRFSQNFDLTFDLSVHDMFLCWRVGAELTVPSEKDLEDPAAYVLRDGVTNWFSVPSLAQKMNLLGSLRPGALSQLRSSLFCGEALPLDLARKWQLATGHTVENWYGPTEATIACLRYVLPANSSDLKTHLGLTPIGACLPGMALVVLDSDFKETPVGEIGELFVTGPQLSTGYINDPEKTAKAFVTLPGRSGIYYRTGDRVKLHAPDELHFVDRTDNQIKIRGYRVEIGEIEQAIRDLTGGCAAIVTPLPLKSPNPTVLVASVEGWRGDIAALLKSTRAKLPPYMAPTTILQFDSFPKNASGKVDRGQIGTAVTERLENDGGGDNQGMAKTLIGMIRKLNPALNRQSILAASDLMDAGLDSVAFTELTLTIEGAFGVALDQELVAEMSEMRFQKLVNTLKKLADAKLARPGRAKAKAAKADRPAAPAAEDGDDTFRTTAKALVAMVQKINPALSGKAIRAANDLMDAGLDSIGFTELSLAIETEFGVTLDQTKVAEMAEMNFRKLANFIIKEAAAAPNESRRSAKKRAKAAAKPVENVVHTKSRRTVELVQKFPDFVAKADHPLALFFGSCGISGGIDAATVEAEARALGMQVTAANMGMAKLSNRGTVELVEYARDVVARQGKEVAFIIYELELSQLSTLPTGRELEVVKAYLNGGLILTPNPSPDPSNRWDPATHGTIRAPRQGERTDRPEVAELTPNWSQRREKEIVSIYAGEVDFVDDEIAAWLQGAEIVKAMTPNVLSFISPINIQRANETNLADPANRVGQLLRRVRADANVPVILHRDFRMKVADFKTYNHMNGSSGMFSLSRQLTQAAVKLFDNTQPKGAQEA